MASTFAAVHPAVLGPERANDCRQSEIRKLSHFFQSGLQISPESNSEDPMYTDVKVKYLHKDIALSKLSCMCSYLDALKCLPVIYCFQISLS